MIRLACQKGWNSAVDREGKPNEVACVYVDDDGRRRSLVLIAGCEMDDQAEANYEVEVKRSNLYFNPGRRRRRRSRGRCEGNPRTRAPPSPQAGAVTSRGSRRPTRGGDKRGTSASSPFTSKPSKMMGRALQVITPPMMMTRPSSPIYRASGIEPPPPSSSLPFSSSLRRASESTESAPQPPCPQV